MRTTTASTLAMACRPIFATMMATGVALVVALAPSSLHAQGAEFPNKTLRMIVPYAVGGPTDLLARMVALKMSQGLGQTMIVENRAGGGTMIGSRAALQAPPDGYTLLMATTTTALGPLTYKEGIWPDFAVGNQRQSSQTLIQSRVTANCPIELLQSTREFFTPDEEITGNPVRTSALNLHSALLGLIIRQAGGFAPKADF